MSTTAARSVNAPPTAAPAVPWSEVVPLAVLLAAADCFWVVVLRGAVGPVERSGAPFTSWVRETTLLAPLFALAVVVALAWALRWFGPTPRGTRAVTGTLGLTWLAGTLAGVAVLVASTAYDYRLEAAGLVHMGEAHQNCAAECLAFGLDATGRQQLLAVAVGAGLIALTNVLVVGYVVCLRGGRVVTSRLQPPGRPDHGDLQVLLAGGLVGAAVIHAAVVPEHWEEWPSAGVFFAVLAAAQLGCAVAVTRSTSRVGLGAAVVLCVGPLLVWAVSRTTGLPFGPEAGVREGVGIADWDTGLLELVALVVAVPLLWAHSAPRALSLHVRAMAVTGVLALTTIGIGGTGLSVVHAFGVPGHAEHGAAEVAP